MTPETSVYVTFFRSRDEEATFEGRLPSVPRVGDSLYFGDADHGPFTVSSVTWVLRKHPSGDLRTRVEVTLKEEAEP